MSLCPAQFSLQLAAGRLVQAAHAIGLTSRGSQCQESLQTGLLLHETWIFVFSQSVWCAVVRTRPEPDSAPEPGAWFSKT